MLCAVLRYQEYMAIPTAGKFWRRGFCDRWTPVASAGLREFVATRCHAVTTMWLEVYVSCLDVCVMVHLVGIPFMCREIVFLA